MATDHVTIAHVTAVGFVRGMASGLANRAGIAAFRVTADQARPWVPSSTTSAEPGLTAVRASPSSHPALIGAAWTTSLIAVLPDGGAEAIASRGRSPDHDELLDHAALEIGTD